MKFFVVEGVDGSGKSTQIKNIKNHFETNNIPYRYLHFPRTDIGIYGDLIARFLRGDFGGLDTVNPYLVALIYAGDRKEASLQVREWLSNGFIVLLDRYVYSNIAYQCAKISDVKKQEELRNWILNLEYNYFNIPRPDLNIVLDVPSAFSRQNLDSNRTGLERDYLNGMHDIHEKDAEFQSRVRDMYLLQSTICNDIKIINCTDENGKMHQPDFIFKEILNQLKF